MNTTDRAIAEAWAAVQRCVNLVEEFPTEENCAALAREVARYSGTFRAAKAGVLAARKEFPTHDRKGNPVVRRGDMLEQVAAALMYATHWTGHAIDTPLACVQASFFWETAERRAFLERHADALLAALDALGIEITARFAPS